MSMALPDSFRPSDLSESTSPTLSCLAGVDEAGLGPVLGPLVIAGVALRGPRGIDAWDALAGTVAKRRPGPHELVVADSKRVNVGPRGLERLERTVLGFWGAWRGAVPANLRELLELLGVDLARLRRCPWYEELELPLPLRGNRDEIELRVHLLERALRRARIEILHLAGRCVVAEEFNDLIARTDNKHRTHFHVYAQVIAELLGKVPDGSRLIADRCGGQTRYRKSLADVYPGSRVDTLSESDEVSSYRVRTASDTVQVSFASRGEDRAFPTALASCCAKYLRELMVTVLNRWFAARVPDLAPTKGYYVDGRRFLRDIESFARERSLPMSRLVRVR
jgi:hypothetical protein